MLLKYTAEIIRLNQARLLNRYIRPRFINFLLTYRCNARCIMCKVWDLYNHKPGLLKDELTAEQIKKFVIDNRDALSELRNLGFSGGDPLLMRADFVKIVAIFRSLLPSVHLGVQTNGLIPELARERLREIISFKSPNCVGLPVVSGRIQILFPCCSSSSVIFFSCSFTLL